MTDTPNIGEHFDHQRRLFEEFGGRTYRVVMHSGTSRWKVLTLWLRYPISSWRGRRRRDDRFDMPADHHARIYGPFPRLAGLRRGGPTPKN